MADRGRGLLEGNEVTGNGEAGVRVETRGDPLVQRENRVHAGRAEGVLVAEGGAGVVRGNRVFGNRLAGIKARAAPPPRAPPRRAPARALPRRPRAVGPARR